VMMDVEIIAGLCPKASISIYFSTFGQDGWIDLLKKVNAARPLPVALSISWGRAEKDWSDDARDNIDYQLYQASKLGITVCVASGDDGWRDDVNMRFPDAHVDFPSSSPNVMSVGGTMLRRSGAKVKEVTWVDPGTPERRGAATGGGVSMSFPRPAWQKKVNITRLFQDFKGRVVPDVCALAGEPYYDLLFNRLPWPDGKTSASAPVWAALIARINAKLPPNKRQRFLSPLLYQELPNRKWTVAKVSFRDITFGKNAPKGDIGYIARSGFDAATGWGAPDGVKLLNCLAQV